MCSAPPPSPVILSVDTHGGWSTVLKSNSAVRRIVFKIFLLDSVPPIHGHWIIFIWPALLGFPKTRVGSLLYRDTLLAFHHNILKSYPLTYWDPNPILPGVLTSNSSDSRAGRGETSGATGTDKVSCGNSACPPPSSDWATGPSKNGASRSRTGGSSLVEIKELSSTRLFWALDRHRAKRLSSSQRELT